MFVGDRTKMRQVSGAIDVPIGLPPPTVAATAVAGVTTILLAMTTNWRPAERRVQLRAGAGGVLVSFGGGF